MEIEAAEPNPRRVGFFTLFDLFESHRIEPLHLFIIEVKTLVLTILSAAATIYFYAAQRTPFPHDHPLHDASEYLIIGLMGLFAVATVVFTLAGGYAGIRRGYDRNIGIIEGEIYERVPVVGAIIGLSYLFSDGVEARNDYGPPPHYFYYYGPKIRWMRTTPILILGYLALIAAIIGGISGLYNLLI